MAVPGWTQSPLRFVPRVFMYQHEDRLHVHFTLKFGNGGSKKTNKNNSSNESNTTSQFNSISTSHDFNHQHQLSQQPLHTHQNPPPKQLLLQPHPKHTTTTPTNKQTIKDKHISINKNEKFDRRDLVHFRFSNNRWRQSHMP